jgi:hypothetical protein
MVRGIAGHRAGNLFQSGLSITRRATARPWQSPSFLPKGADVRTTIDEQVGRRGGAYSVEDLENTLNQARKLLADTMALLELENERFFKTEFDKDDKDHLDTVMDLIKRVQKAMQSVIDMELKYGLSPFDARQQLDLEAARAEILERFRRLPRKVA